MISPLKIKIFVIIAFFSIGSIAQGAVITVNSMIDENPTAPDQDCTLREAIMAANNNGPVDNCTAGDPGLDTIEVPTGIYLLSHMGVGENAGNVGDLDIIEDVTIIGSGVHDTFIDGGRFDLPNPDRVFDIIGSPNNPSVTFLNLTIQNGFSSVEGGGIHHLGTGSLQVENAGILNNRAIEGGGIYIEEGDLTVRFTTIDNNAATDENAIGGGGIMHKNAMNGDTTIESSTISNNISARFGGGLDHTIANGGSLMITNSTFSGNFSVSAGGGLRNNAFPTQRIINSTFYQNGSLLAGDNIASSSDIEIVNTIIAGGLFQQNCSSSLTSLGNNLEDSDTCGFAATGDLIETDPLLGNLADNGGPTLTHALLEKSPAIDAADNVSCPTSDQRGIDRPLDGNDDGTADCDIGAIEQNRCGDGVILENETCDDGNITNGDGCSDSCQIESPISNGGPDDPDGGPVGDPGGGNPNGITNSGGGCILSPAPSTGSPFMVLGIVFLVLMRLMLRNGTASEVSQ